MQLCVEDGGWNVHLFSLHKLSISPLVAYNMGGHQQSEILREEVGLWSIVWRRIHTSKSVPLGTAPRDAATVGL